ncbi:MAG: hypothetical protein KF881_08220 [Acidobacteria bacterium]|nr:hypothetical protein [Acidobacteriota bacterium]
MKICPTCRKTYADTNLNFCLEDGSVLTVAPGQTAPDTVFVNQPRPTQPQPQMQQPGHPQWNVQQQHSMQPKKSSRAWVWVLLILGGMGLICGGGLVGFIFIAANQEPKAANTKAENANTTEPANTASSTSTRKKDESPDLSKWVQSTKSFGETEFTDGQFIMSSRAKGYYYVLAATSKYKSVGADVQVSATNLDNGATDLGFGLVFHSDTTPLQKGYAFVIDSAKKRYRIVNHTPKKEDVVVNWTRSDAIKDGKQENILEIRDGDSMVDLFINGKKVNSIRNVHGFPNGVVGLYTGDGIKIAFKDLEIRR